MKKPPFLKTTPLNNIEILKWIKYFDVHNFKIISREGLSVLKKNHNYIVNLDDFDSQGSHWCAWSGPNYYFDSFGMPPPQELRGEFVYNSTHYQDLKSSTCGYFCLYFINSINQGKSYEEVVEPFSHTDQQYNEKFIENYFTSFQTR